MCILRPPHFWVRVYFKPMILIFYERWYIQLSRKNRLRKSLAAVLAVTLCGSAVPLTAFAYNSGYSGSENLTEEEKAAFYTEKATYSDYYDEHSSDKYPDKAVPLTYSSAEDGAEVEVKSFEGKDNVIVWSNQEGTVNFTVDVPESGNYNIKLTYYPIPGNMTTSEISVLLDGDSPYDAATRVELPHTFVMDGEITRDSKDNDQAPMQVESPMWRTTSVNDPDGIFNEPLIFNLSEGTHTISFNSERAAIAISSVELYHYDEPEAYVAPSESEFASNSSVANIKIQGENYSYTNSAEILPSYDRGDYRTEDHNGDPGSPTKQRYNTLGGSWKTTGQSVTWTVEVPEDGYYHLGIKGMQNSMRGMYSNRRLYVDGEVPNSAFEDIKFNYDSDWLLTTPTDENGDEAYLYLTKGTHELTLEVIPGEIGEFIRRLDEVVSEVNSYYLQILMITGPSPDKYTDYYVYKEIPELLDEFERLSAELRDIQSEIEALSNQKGSEAAALERLATVLDYCVKKPDKIPNQISNSALKDNVASVSSWMRTYRQQPLTIDYIELAPASGELSSVKNNVGKSFVFGCKSFFGSFFEDYTVLSDTTENSVNVWSSLGRDQTNVVKQMVDSQFNGKYGVDVAINLVQGGIMEAVLAGKGPDVSLFTGGEFPINLAIRDLLEPINDKEGFDEVYARYAESAFVPYTYENTPYAIPLTRNFPMMFYRKDILSSIGIYEYPETWDDLIDMLPAFQRNYMQPGLVLPGVAVSNIANAAGTSVSPATEEGHTFALLMLQSGLNYYNEDQSETNFDSQEAVEAFDTWTKFYTTYGFDQTYDAFTRFRTGEAPIVIQDYCSFYNQLNTAAPEIAGLWDFAPVPGTVREDGTVNHAANSNSAGAMILSSCKNPDAAWTFIKWFSDTDQMVQYAQNVEGVMGSMGRVAPADQEALKRLNWSKSELDKIIEQMDQLDEIPIIPSSYVVTRGVMNAFRAVVNDHDNARETLRWYNKDINKEITRKRQNLGIDDTD